MPEEKFEAISNLRDKIQDNFIELGELFLEIKHRKLFKAKGFISMKDFVESEYNISYYLVSKLIDNYSLFVKELGLYQDFLKKLGFDKLNIIKPMIKNKEYSIQKEWLDNAEKYEITDLKEMIKEIKDKERELTKSVQDIFVDKFYDGMTTFFGCNRKTLDFKLALFFMNIEFPEIQQNIRKNQEFYNQQVKDVS